MIRSIVVAVAIALATPAFAQPGIPRCPVGLECVSGGDLFTITGAEIDPAPMVLAQQQAAPATDQEIAEQHAFCNKPENFVPIGSVGNHPPNAGRYKPEWSACEVVDAEYDKRQLAAQAKQADALKKLNSVIGRIPK